MGAGRLVGADVGRRVVVRHLLADGRATDVLGRLVQLDDGAVVVRREDGEVARVDPARVVAARVVPPRPAVAREVLALEEVAAAGWAPRSARRLGGWVLREHGGWTRRANSALVLGPPDPDAPAAPTGAAIAAVEAFYDAAGLRPRFSLPALASGRPLDAGLDAELARRGWVSEAPTTVMTAPLDDVAGQLAGGPPGADAREGVVARVDPHPSTAWRAAFRHGGEPLGAAGEELLATAPPGGAVGFAALEGPSGGLLALARGTCERGWLGLTGVQVDPAARRRGLGRAVVGALVDWAGSCGARRVFLQVEDDNAPALALYDGLGLTVHHRSAYRVRP